MKRTELLYVLSVQACVLAMSSVAGLVFLYLHGLTPAIRMFVGTFLVTNLTLIWVFRQSLVRFMRRLLLKR